MPVTLFSPPLPTTISTLCTRTQNPQECFRTFLPKRRLSLLVACSGDSEAGAVSSVAVEKEGEAPAPVTVEGEKKPEALESKGAAASTEASVKAPKFKDPRWVRGTWDLEQFKKVGRTDWDAVIDAEARRRKWLEENPETSCNDDPVVFDTSIIPWWAWVKRFHLPEAERLNGRAAMIGFFMAYFVDALTGIGLVDQMGSYFCKTLLLLAVAGVLLIRKNEDIGTLRKLLEETTFYDKQWQATWKDENAGNSSEE
uniref:High molecular mass early light-inducible protein HV58, chloroplastic n=1 Tax=Anthurium amnicola TaxID=1678845 RepID=A0A1D1Y447_9ARAE